MLTQSRKIFTGSDFDWEDREYYASDYFGKLFDFAVDLIKRGLAYVDDQPADMISAAERNPYPTRN